MNREQGLAELERTRIIAIVRGVEQKSILPLAQALLEGGVTVMEVTLNTPGALEMIPLLQKEYGERMYIGVGTVLDLDDARQAINSGAAFIVTPNTDEAVIRYVVERDVPIFPGAMTPTEVVNAWKAGASAVKIFPSSILGIAFIKELRGPLNHIPIVAVGGVNEENIHEFFEVGCTAIGIGGSLINLKVVAAGDYAWITGKAKSLIEAAKR